MLQDWLLELLRCPRCKGELTHETEPEALVCPACAVRYPVRDGIPVLLLDEAQPLDPAARG
jgi:uncharacterized protein YbaR (Trm112 family)